MAQTKALTCTTCIKSLHSTAQENRNDASLLCIVIYKISTKTNQALHYEDINLLHILKKKILLQPRLQPYLKQLKTDQISSFDLGTGTGI